MVTIPLLHTLLGQDKIYLGICHVPSLKQIIEVCDPEIIGTGSTKPGTKKSQFNYSIQINQPLMPGIFWLDLPVAIILFWMRLFIRKINLSIISRTISCVMFTKEGLSSVCITLSARLR